MTAKYQVPTAKSYAGMGINAKYAAPEKLVDSNGIQGYMQGMQQEMQNIPKPKIIDYLQRVRTMPEVIPFAKAGYAGRPGSGTSISNIVSPSRILDYGHRSSPGLSYSPRKGLVHEEEERKRRVSYL